LAVLCALLTVLTSVGGSLTGVCHSTERVWQERKQALLQVRQEAQPILAALEAYHRDHGHYPSSLERLCPAYLPRISLPTLPGYGTFGKAWEYRWSDTCAPYELVLAVPPDFCPRCSLSFGDCFVYSPTGDYPRFAYGGALERIEDWAYYHE
jgi:hypothetical protein